MGVADETILAATPRPDAGPRPRDTRRRARWILPISALVLVATASAAFAAKVYVHERAQGRELGQAINDGRSKDAVIDRLVDVLSAQGDLDPAVLTGAALRDVDDLPGRRHRTTAAQRDLMARATVQLGRRSGPGAPWERHCTGTVVEYVGQRMVMTAAHCFLTDLPVDDVDWDEGAIDVRDLTRRVGEWGVLAGTTTADDASSPPVAVATSRRVAMSVRSDSDWALLTVTDPAGLAGFGAVDLQAQVTAPVVPEPGEEVTLHGFPQSASGAQVVARGRYLGRMTDGFGSFTQPTDVVAIDPGSSEVDACFFGASGSSAGFASGLVSGPLSARNSLGYGAEHTLVDPDEAGAYERLHAEDLLRVHLLQGPTVLCGYSVMDLRVVEALLGRLGLPPIA